MNWRLQIACCTSASFVAKTPEFRRILPQIMNEAISNLRFEIRRRKKYGAGRFHHEERNPAPTA